MPTFIDESGDTGSVSSGGKPFFRLAAVWMPTMDDAETFREDVRSLRKRLGLRADYEFKFVATHQYPARRNDFFRTALASPFKFVVCAIDKTADQWKAEPGHVQHWACAAVLSAYLAPFYRDAEEKSGQPFREPVIVDDNGDRDFLGVVKEKFRDLKSIHVPGRSLTGKIDFRDSGPEELLQLVDMVCGAVGAHLDGDATWYNLIATREIVTLRLP